MEPSDVSPAGEARGSIDLFDEMLADLLERRYIVMDQHGRISRWGAGAETSLGWREEEVSSRCGVSSPLAWCGDGLGDWTTHLQAPRESTPPLRSPLTMLCRDGSGLPIDAIAVQVPLRLGFEFTMLVGDLAVGGPGSLSTERMGQAHRLATDAIA
ncbi:MAG TPA: hypothetical protein VH256_09535, partial [Thermoleophilaceae bacterium]|nr:hypothetical protein [Thermoleophilaceae bacterium]